MVGEKKLFAVIAVGRPEALAPRIQELFPENFFLVEPGQWLLVAPATTTTQELSVSLGISSDASVSDAIVLNVSSYFGRASLNTWEWLAAKMGDTNAVAG